MGTLVTGRRGSIFVDGEVEVDADVEGCDDRKLCWIRRVRRVVRGDGF